MGIWRWLTTGYWRKPPPRVQEPIGDKFVEWADPGKCPDCKFDSFYFGPRAGICQNVKCMCCHREFNVCVFDDLALIHRINTDGTAYLANERWRKDTHQ